MARGPAMVNPTKMVERLSDIADGYDAAICDVWGVVHDGRRAYDKACAALAAFRRERGPILLLSNAPRPGHDVMRQLDGFGVPRDAYDAVLTSGDATRAELARRAHVRTPLPIHHIGPDRDLPLIDGLAVERVPLEQSEVILCSGLFDDETETPADYRELLARARSRELAMICANPDLMVERGPKLIYCAGALAEVFERMDGQVIYFGKPYRPIYDEAFARLGELCGRSLKRRQVLAIGDGLRTDVKGANDAGLDVLLVTAGLHVREFGTDPERPDPVRIGAVLAEWRLQVAVAMPRLE